MALEPAQNLREIIEKMKMDFEQLVELEQTNARLLRAKYEALIEAGFKEREALEIIKARGLSAFNN